MSHDCVEQINRLLADRNTALPTALSFSNPERELIEVATVKKDTAVRGKPVRFFASYCPFCGKKLNQGGTS